MTKISPGRGTQCEKYYNVEKKKTITNIACRPDKILSGTILTIPHIDSRYKVPVNDHQIFILNTKHEIVKKIRATCCLLPQDQVSKKKKTLLRLSIPKLLSKRYSPILFSVNGELSKIELFLIC